MRTSGALLIIGGVLCAAVWMIWSGWRQPRPRLADTIGRLQRTATSETVTASPSGDGLAVTDGSLAAVGAVVLRGSGAERLDGWTQPLRLIGRPLDVHVGLLVAAAIAGLVTPIILASLAALIGVASTAMVIPAAVSIACAIVAPLAIHSNAMARADEIRIDLRHQLAAYLDMVTMLLAGNSGHEGALEQAARAGDGLLFRQLRRRIREVSTTGTSLVTALSLVADDYGMVELEQVAAATALSAAEGAPVARTLAAKCSTLRSTLASDEETAARIRNDKVTPPLVGMALLFMALIIYPALNLH
jgi:Flp pilus assembly protein TadB